MSEYQDGPINDLSGSNEPSEAASNIFLNMAEPDSTGIPSLKQAPVSVISSTTSDSKVNTQLVIAACVLAVGAGAIYGMRYIGMQAGLDESMTSIDYASESNTTDFAKRFTSVMKTLDESSTSIRLTDHDSFPDAPFSRPAFGDDAEPIDPGMSQAERDELTRERERAREIERRQELVIDEAMRFKLQGIIGGSRPAARVSGLPVRAGMPLGDYFTVIEITGLSVIIEGDGLRFELAMGEETVRLD